MAKARQDYKDERAAASEREKARLEKEKAEAAIANAEARYGGMFGNARKRRDKRKMKEGKYSESKADYVASALGGSLSLGYGGDRTDYEGINEDVADYADNGVYDGYVEDQ
jgi:hypothetical protein